MVCGKPGITRDHVLFNQQKGAKKAMRDWRNSRFNLQPACVECNNNHLANTEVARINHIRKMLGEDGFIMWFDAYPGSKKKGCHWLDIKRMIESEVELHE